MGWGTIKMARDRDFYQERRVPILMHYQTRQKPITGLLHVAAVFLLIEQVVLLLLIMIMPLATRGAE